MSRSAARSIVGRGLLIALLVTFVLTLAAPRAQSAPTPPGEQALLSDFGSCLAGGATGSIVLLIDQSGSLATTDPEGARVDGAKFLVERLADFSDTSGYALDVRVAGFAATYETPGDWTPLQKGNVAALEGQIDTIGGDLRSHDTDYWVALESARQDLADHGGECSAIFWFSDGEYDIDPRESRQSRRDYGETKPYAPEVEVTDDAGAAEAVAAGKADICRPAGVADQLRRSGITVIGVGLMSDGSDFSFLRSVTEGGGPEAAQRNQTEQCGDVASPEGAYFEVDDLDTLLMAFDALSSPGDSLSSSSVEICQGEECGAGEVSFVLDRALRSVRVLASSDVDGLEAYVIPPGKSDALRFPSSAGAEAVEQGGAEAAWLTPRTVELEIDAEVVDTWDGTWRVGFVDPSSRSAGEQISVNLHLSSPLVLEWQDLDAAEIRQGADVADVSLVLVDRTDGQVVDAADLGGTLTADVTLTDADGVSHTLFSTQDKAALSGPVTIRVPAEAALGEARVVTSLQITTAPPTVDGETAAEGTTLQPALAALTTSVLPPQNFPTVGPRIDFGLLEEETTAQAVLDVTGPGCVWLAPESTSVIGAPSEAGTISVTSPASSEGECVRLAEGEQAALTIELDTEDHANGAVQGTVGVMIAPEDDPSAAQTVTVPFDADLRRPLDVTTAGAAFAVALVLGIGIPLLALLVLTWFTARIPKGTLVSGSTRISLPAGGGRTEIALERNHLTLTSLPTAQRNVAVAGRMLRARFSPLPTEAPWVELDDSSPSISGAVPGSRRGRARLPLGVRGNWVAIPDLHDPSTATLIVLLGAEDQTSLDAVLEDARKRVADRVRSLGLTAAPPTGGAGPSRHAAPGGPQGSSAGWGNATGSPGSDSAGAPSGWGSSRPRQDPPRSPWGSP